MKGTAMKRKHRIAAWIFAPIMLGACAQIVGIEDPIPIDENDSSSSTSGSGSGAGGSSSSGSGSSSSGSASGGGDPGPWVNWVMPNPVAASLPNKADYIVDMTKDIVTDNVTNLVWQRTYSAMKITWAQAKTYCANLDHGGYTDWRLPWRIELVSLIDYTKSFPAIDGAAFVNTPSDGFWTASNYPADTTYSWLVYFDDGDTFVNMATNPFYARCVRSK